MLRVLFVFGTRPEAIKMAPVIRTFQKEVLFDTKVCVTGQHRHMLDQVLETFAISPDFDLNLMKPNQSLTSLTIDILSGIQKIIASYKPNWIFVHGDTTTTLASSLAAYYGKVSVAHIEAGLRSGNIYAPWPEEINRKLVSNIARLNYAPSQENKLNLLKEGVAESSIIVTGNTVIDALRQVSEKLDAKDPRSLSLIEDLPQFKKDRKLILVTAHRRENFGNAIENVCLALDDISKKNDVEIVYPVHLNPNIRLPVEQILGGNPSIHLLEPLDYVPFIHLLKASYLILSDSGGIQEEATFLGKPLLLFRDNTERPEAIDAGIVKLVGTDRVRICNEASLLLNQNESYPEMGKSRGVYGDGNSATLIFDHFKSHELKQNLNLLCQ